MSKSTMVTIAHQRKALISILLLSFLATFLIYQIVYSLRWPIAHDEAPLLYSAFLMRTENRVPYRDIFDFQMPGAYIIYYALAVASGLNGFYVRLIDISLLISISTITFSIMQKFGKLTAFSAAILFGLKYMQGGAYMSLQREYLLLIFIIAAVWINIKGKLTFKYRLLSGLLFGIAATIKPHILIGIIPIILFDYVESMGHSKTPRIHTVGTVILPIALGISIPILAVFTWLASKNALYPFFEIALNFWPLYGQINGNLEILSFPKRIQYFWLQLFFMHANWVWLFPWSIGVYLLPKNRKRPAYFLSTLALCYVIYPAFTGQFFPYHYIPFFYFAVLLGSLCLTSDNYHGLSVKRFLAIFIFFLVVFVNIRPSETFVRQLNGQPISPSLSRSNEIAYYLNNNIREGDTVQALDWTGGALLAMLKTRAHLATPYIFDFYFYQHVSNPYIQNLRADFMKKLKAEYPRFIIEITAIDKPWVTGEDTSREFPELRAFIMKYYSITVEQGGYLIYKRHER